MITTAELLRLLESRKVLTAAQAEALAREHAGAASGSDAGVEEALVVGGRVTPECLLGIRAVFGNLAWRFGEPKDLEFRLLRLGLVTTKDLARVRRIRDEVRRICPDDVPSVSQTLFHLGVVQPAAVVAELVKTQGPRTAASPEAAVPIVPIASSAQRPATRRLYKARPVPPRRGVPGGDVPVAPVLAPVAGAGLSGQPVRGIVDAVPLRESRRPTPVPPVVSAAADPGDETAPPSRDFRLMFDFELTADAS